MNIVKDGDMEARKAEARRKFLSRRNTYANRTCDECGCIFFLTEEDLNIDPKYRSFDNTWFFQTHITCPSCGQQLGWIQESISLKEAFQADDKKRRKLDSLEVGFIFLLFSFLASLGVLVYLVVDQL